MTDKCEPSGMCSRATESGRTCERGRCIAFVRGEIGLVWRPPFPRLYAAWGTIWVLSIYPLSWSPDRLIERCVASVPVLVRTALYTGTRIAKRNMISSFVRIGRYVDSKIIRVRVRRGSWSSPLAEHSTSPFQTVFPTTTPAIHPVSSSMAPSFSTASAGDFPASSPSPSSHSSK